MIDCLHPRLVYSKSLGRKILVSCGKCLNCLSRSANKYTRYCFSFEKEYRYTMFITLTYTNENVPTCVPDVVTDSESHFRYVRFINVTERLKKYYDVIFESDNSKFMNDVSFLSSKEVKPIGFNASVDIQNFHKRFRKYIDKHLSNEKDKISYSHFSVSEYGARRFRPHWHCLLFFNSETLYFSFERVLRSCWSLGRVDFSLSRGGASSYVARYINSLNNLPSLLCQGDFKCRKFHSLGFSDSALVKRFAHYKDVQKFQFRNFVRNGVQKFGENSTFFFSSYDSYKLFPKLPYAKYTFSNLEELRVLYNFYPLAKTYYRYHGLVNLSCSDLAQLIDFDLHDGVRNTFTNYFNSVIDNHQDSFDFIYRHLLISKRFIDDVISWKFEDTTFVLCDFISFFTIKSLNTLFFWYKEQEELMRNRSPYILFLYDNFLTNRGNLRKGVYSLSDFHMFIDTLDNSYFYNFTTDVKYLNQRYVSSRYNKSLFNQIKLTKHKQLNSELWQI